MNWPFYACCKHAVCANGQALADRGGRHDRAVQKWTLTARTNFGSSSGQGLKPHPDRRGGFGKGIHGYRSRKDRVR